MFILFLACYFLVFIVTNDHFFEPILNIAVWYFGGCCVFTLVCIPVLLQVTWYKLIKVCSINKSFHKIFNKWYCVQFCCGWTVTHLQHLSDDSRFVFGMWMCIPRDYGSAGKCPLAEKVVEKKQCNNNCQKTELLSFISSINRNALKQYIFLELLAIKWTVNLYVIVNY